MQGAIECWQKAFDLYPADAPTTYNMACGHALQGHVAEAVDFLGTAISLDGECRAMARDDPDFDGIRADPRFEALVGAPGGGTDP